MKLWLDDLRPAPEGYCWVKTVDEAIFEILYCERECDWYWKCYFLDGVSAEQTVNLLKTYTITEISCDNDLGEKEPEGYKLLDWLEATKRNYPIRIHSANPVARERMQAIIRRNNWKEIK